MLSRFWEMQSRFQNGTVCRKLKVLKQEPVPKTPIEPYFQNMTHNQTVKGIACRWRGGPGGGGETEEEAVTKRRKCTCGGGDEDARMKECKTGRWVTNWKQQDLKDKTAAIQSFQSSYPILWFLVFSRVDLNIFFCIEMISLLCTRWVNANLPKHWMTHLISRHSPWILQFAYEAVRLSYVCWRQMESPKGTQE